MANGVIYNIDVKSENYAFAVKLLVESNTMRLLSLAEHNAKKINRRTYNCTGQ